MAEIQKGYQLTATRALPKIKEQGFALYLSQMVER
jgi:hypothetical protein